MGDNSIPEQRLIAWADTVAIWVANGPAPKDVWSLREAIAWVESQPNKAGIRLFCPDDPTHRSVWLSPDQIARLSQALVREEVAAR
jgi:hypothetical protein